MSATGLAVVAGMLVFVLLAGLGALVVLVLALPILGASVVLFGVAATVVGIHEWVMGHVRGM